MTVEQPNVNPLGLYDLPPESLKKIVFDYLDDFKSICRLLVATGCTANLSILKDLLDTSKNVPWTFAWKSFHTEWERGPLVVKGCFHWMEVHGIGIRSLIDFPPDLPRPSRAVEPLHCCYPAKSYPFIQSIRFSFYTPVKEILPIFETNIGRLKNLQTLDLAGLGGKKTDHILFLVAENCPKLRTLKGVVFNKHLNTGLSVLSIQNNLERGRYNMSGASINALAKSCPLLTTLEITVYSVYYPSGGFEIAGVSDGALQLLHPGAFPALKNVTVLLSFNRAVHRNHVRSTFTIHGVNSLMKAFCTTVTNLKTLNVSSEAINNCQQVTELSLLIDPRLASDIQGRICLPLLQKLIIRELIENTDELYLIGDTGTYFNLLPCLCALAALHFSTLQWMEIDYYYNDGDGTVSDEDKHGYIIQLIESLPSLTTLKLGIDLNVTDGLLLKISNIALALESIRIETIIDDCHHPITQLGIACLDKLARHYRLRSIEVVDRSGSKFSYSPLLRDTESPYCFPAHCILKG